MAEDSFSLSHPHGIRLAVAARRSIDDALISEVSGQSPADFEAALIRMASLVSHPLTMGKAATVDVLLVDEGAVHRVELKGRGSKIQRHTAEVPPSALLRIVTTRPVVQSLGAMELRVAEAMKQGLLEIEDEVARR